jgi:hypothetical protein
MISSTHKLVFFCLVIFSTLLSCTTDIKSENYKIRIDKNERSLIDTISFEFMRAHYQVNLESPFNVNIEENHLRFFIGNSKTPIQNKQVFDLYYRNLLMSDLINQNIIQVDVDSIHFNFYFNDSIWENESYYFPEYKDKFPWQQYDSSLVLAVNYLVQSDKSGELLFELDSLIQADYSLDDQYKGSFVNLLEKFYEAATNESNHYTNMLIIAINLQSSVVDPRFKLINKFMEFGNLDQITDDMVIEFLTSQNIY